MDTTKNKEIGYLSQKISTNILGLDRLLYDGLDLTEDGNIILIRGEVGSEKTLFGMQLLYGVAQSIDSLNLGKDIHHCFFSSYVDERSLNDWLLDMIISSGIQNMTDIAVSTPGKARATTSFAQAFFKVNAKILGKEHNMRIPYEKVMNSTDELICNEAIYYNNRTNALHFRYYTEEDSHNSPLLKTDDSNMLFKRKYLSISRYLEINNNNSQEVETIKSLGKSIGYPIVDVQMKKVEKDALIDVLSKIGKGGIVAVDTAFEGMDEHSTITFLASIVGILKNQRLGIIIVPSDTKIPESDFDMIIDLTSQTKTAGHSDYAVRYLAITKSRKQEAAKGVHQYKKRDYGLEIYPSLYTYFQQRRYLQRAMVYTHSDVITDTYQQYIDKHKFLGNTITYDNYAKDIEEMPMHYLNALYPKYDSDYNSIDVLERIMLTSGSSELAKNKDNDEKNEIENLIYGYRGGVTAIIGEANTYKRFLTFGSVFSSSLHKEHTLFLLLNKDDSTIRRRLACPARMNKDKDCTHCLNCYKYMHFMNIYMGSITTEKFIYFFDRQLEVCFADGKKIKRVVIDDLEIVDFCFPFLKENELFLAALILICKERGISLYVLCDKHGKQAKALKALSENVIYTDRDKNGKLLIYIEKYAGYNNTPSKIYCGKVKSVKNLFECYDRMDEKEQTSSYFAFNTMQIEDSSVSSMEDFWDNK